MKAQQTKDLQLWMFAAITGWSGVAALLFTLIDVMRSGGAS